MELLTLSNESADTKSLKDWEHEKPRKCLEPGGERVQSNENVGRLSVTHASSTCSRKKKRLEELYSCPVCVEEVEMVEDGGNTNALMSVRALRMGEHT